MPAATRPPGATLNSSPPTSTTNHTRRAYARACRRFFAWCENRGLSLTAIRPFDVAAWVKDLQQTHGAPGVKQQLAAVRMLFDWLITGQIVPMNPAAAVRGPKHVVKTGKTPVLEGDEWRKLLNSIPTTTLRDLRDRALIATLTYSFARITAALRMKVEDLRPRGAGWTIRLHEKGGKEHAMPCHHALADALRAYIDAAGIAEDRKGFLFRTSPIDGHVAGLELFFDKFVRTRTDRLGHQLVRVGLGEPLRHDERRSCHLGERIEQ